MNIRYVPFSGYAKVLAIWFSATVFCLWGAAISSFARDIEASSTDGLMQALSEATSGDRIVLAPGRYEVLNLDGKSASFDQSVEITAKDKSDPPAFAGIKINKAENLIFSHLTFDYVFSPGDEFSLRSNVVRKAKGIVFRKCVFEGDVAKGSGTFADGFGTAIGLTVFDSTNVTVESSQFKNWYKAAIFNGVEDLVVKNNEVTDIRSDGLDFAEITNGVVEGNYIHDFRMAEGSPDHRDMIQVWTNGTDRPTTNITIRNNFLDIGTGSFTQSIFMRNDLVDKGERGDEMFFRNVVIEGNLIRNAHANGIVVGEAHGVTIRNNTMLQARGDGEGGKISIPALRVSPASTDVVVKGNILPRLTREFKNPSGGWTVEDNILPQRTDPTSPNYYGDLFVNALADKTMSRSDLAFLPDNDIGQSGIGSPLGQLDKTPVKPMAIIRNVTTGKGVFVQNLQIAAAYGPDGKINLSNASVTWDFGDGQTGKGLAAEHRYEGAGKFNVVAKIQVSGQTFSAQRTVLVGRSGKAQ